MKPTNNIFTLGEKISGVFMLFALLWLTVSLPFVSSSQEISQDQVACQDQESKTPGQQGLPGPTEEKTESGPNTLSEFLHDLHLIVDHGSLINTGFKLDRDNEYLAFHPDLVLLPPEA